MAYHCDSGNWCADLDNDSMEIKTFTPSQKQGLQALIDGCAKYGVTDKRMIAYILATAYWESGETMQPIEERGKGAGHPYGSKIDQDGTHYTEPDKIYYGRSHSQITWRSNYKMLSNRPHAKQMGWDFLNHPELLLQMEPSVWCIIHCMWNGLFTGVGLSKYFNSDRTDPVNARRIVNSLDQAQRIADLYKDFMLYL